MNSNLLNTEEVRTGNSTKSEDAGNPGKVE